MGGIGIYIGGGREGNMILPLILMGVEITPRGIIRDHYYVLWTQDGAALEEYIERLHCVMGWVPTGTSTELLYSEDALSLAKVGANTLRMEYLALWDMYFPTLLLVENERRGTIPWHRRMRERVKALPIRLPFVADKPFTMPPSLQSHMGALYIGKANL